MTQNLNFREHSQERIDSLFTQQSGKVRYSVTNPITLQWSKDGSHYTDLIRVAPGQLVWLSAPQAAFPHVAGNITPA